MGLFEKTFLTHFFLIFVVNNKMLVKCLHILHQLSKSYTKNIGLG